MEVMAQHLAVNAHMGQKYGSEPYVTHLYAVVQVLRDAEIRRPEMLAAAWLHDAIEDTSVTKDQIEELCGTEVAELVWACTGVGMNRKARNASIYEKIAKLSEAADIKVADRIANVENAQLNAPSLMSMYLNEREAFTENVANHAQPFLQRRLERAYQTA